MTYQTVKIHSEQQCHELLSEPVHYPLVIDNETVVITLQDQRSIVDRRNWFLSRAESFRMQQTTSQNGSNAPPQYHLPPETQAMIVNLLQELKAVGARQSAPLLGLNIDRNPNGSYCFHYAKQTDTDDLPYYQQRDRLAREERVMKHVHYYVACASKNKATNTDDSGQHMDCDPITDEEDLWNQTRC